MSTTRGSAGAAQWTVALAADATQAGLGAEVQTAPSVTGGTATAWSWSCIDPTDGSSSTSQFSDAAVETPTFTPDALGSWEIRCSVTVGADSQETSRNLRAGAGGTSPWTEVDLTGGTLYQPGSDVIHATTTWAASGSTIILDYSVVAAHSTNCSRRMVSVGNPPAGAANMDRISLVFFHSPNHDAVISCLPSCAEGGEKYPPTTFAEHYLIKVMRSAHARTDAGVTDATADSA